MWCERGKVTVRGSVQLSPSFRLEQGMQVELNLRAQAPRTLQQKQAEDLIVYEDSQVIVINKPAGISSVPYEPEETDTAMDLIRVAWRLQKRAATTTALHVVHRIDKETSGLLMFAKTKGSERFLQQQLRSHSMQRTYLCVAQGHVRSQRIETILVGDRGDGLRGSARHSWQRAMGKKAVTHIEALETFEHATLCKVNLETGKTHQIRIHLSEKGHPLLGEKVYIRDFLRHGKTPLPATRLMLHAQTLGFVHPTTEESVDFSVDPPTEFINHIQRLWKKSVRP